MIMKHNTGVYSWTAGLTRLLNRRRLAYAWVAAGVLWAAWLLALALGTGSLDFAGRPIGTDYLQFYSAGYTLRVGAEAHLYDLAYQAALQRDLLGPGLTTFHAFITPPFLAWVFLPLAWLPYGISFVVWSLSGLVGLWCSVRLLGAGQPLRAFGWALTWFPVFASISYGQNSLLSLFLLSATYALWRRNRPWLAGLVCSLILYKPQLALGVGLLWLLEGARGRRALGGLALGGGALTALSFGLLPQASLAYLDFVRTVLPDLPAWQSFPLWHLHTIRGFWWLLLPGASGWADALTWGFALLGVGGFVAFWRKQRSREGVLFAGAVCVTLWATPHAMIYDWALLLIPAVLLWEAAPAERALWKSLYALLWMVAFLGDPLTYLQWQHWRRAVQFSVPVLLWAASYSARRLERSELPVTNVTAK